MEEFRKMSRKKGFWKEWVENLEMIPFSIIIIFIFFGGFIIKGLFLYATYMIVLAFLVYSMMVLMRWRDKNVKKNTRNNN